MGRRKGKRNRKSQALQPKKTQKFKRVTVREDQRSPSPQPPPPPSQSLADSDLKTENPCLDIVLFADNTAGLKLEASVDTVPISSLPPCPTTPSHLSIVPYEAPLSSGTRSKWKTMKFSLSNHWNRKKLATLSNHFNPIPFVRERPSNVAAHQLLLTRLGLWSFLHLDFDRNIHSDLIKQLVIYYNPKKPSHRRSHVNGWSILVTRAAMARALALPTKRLNVDGNDATRAGPFMVSEEESLFLEELVSSWLVLQDDDSELPGEVIKVRSLIRERRLEDVDWAGLIWFMVKSELLKGENLVDCYYASHMQLLLKNQKPRLFEDHVENAGFLDTGAALCDEENVDKSLSGLKEPEILNRGIRLFNEESEKERFLDVEENAVGVEESGGDQKMETTLQRCYKWRNSSLKECKEEGSTLYGKINTTDFIAVDVNDCEGNKLQDPQTTVIQSPGIGKLEIELNATHEVQDYNVVELRCREEGDVTLNDFECKETDYRQGESNCKEDENGENSRMLMNEDIDEEGQKIECSGDLTTEGMLILTKQETDIQQIDLALSQDKGETKFGLNALAEDKKVIGEKFCIPNQQSAIQKEDGNSELRLLHGEDENQLSEGVATEYLLVSESGELPDSLEKKFSIDFECNEMECQQGKSTDLQFGSANDMLMNEDCHDEGLKIECSSDFTMSGMHILSRLESEFEQSQDKGEKEFRLDALVEDCKIISENFYTLDEQHAVTREDGNRELRLLPSEDENKLSKGLANAEIFDSRTGELLDSREKEVSNDSECKQMNYQQPQLNYLQDKYGKDLDSGSANDILMSEYRNEEGLKIECSSDLTMCGMHSLSRQETEFQQMDLVLSQDKGESEFGLNVLVEAHTVIDGKNFTSDEQCATEMEDGNRELRLQNELSEGLVEDGLFDGKTGELLDNREKKVGNIFISAQQHDIKMEDRDRESRLVHGKYENEFSKGLVKEKLCDAKAGELLDNQGEEVGFSAENCVMDSENRQTGIDMEEEKPELLGIHDSSVEGEEIVKPEASGLNEFLGAEMDLQNKNAVKIEPFVEPFASEQESYMNLADPSSDNSLKREIDYLNDTQFECLNETQKITGINSEAGESFDLDLCSEQAELWLSRLKSAAHKRAQMDNEVSVMLLKELEEKNRIIEHHEKIRRQEQHKRQKDMFRYERELYLMKSVLDEYRTALDQVHESFAQYRKRAQLPEEPIYIDHPDGGGKIVLAAELESSKLKRGRENL